MSGLARQTNSGLGLAGNRLPRGYHPKNLLTFSGRMALGPAAVFMRARLPDLVTTGGYRVSSRTFAASCPPEKTTMTTDLRNSPLALRPRDAAKALGISPRTLWGLSAPRGPIPCVRVGIGKRQSVLYPTAALQAWLTRETTTAEGGAE